MKLCFNLPSYSEGNNGENNSWMCFWFFGVVSRGYLIAFCWSQDDFGLEFSFPYKCWPKEYFYKFLEITTPSQYTCPPTSTPDVGGR
jgi:hypothetical protein